MKITKRISIILSIIMGLGFISCSTNKKPFHIGNYKYEIFPFWCTYRILMGNNVSLLIKCSCINISHILTYIN